jgi:hypothetical protein
MLTFRSSYSSRAVNSEPRDGKPPPSFTSLASLFWAIVYHDHQPNIFIFMYLFSVVFFREVDLRVE